MPERVPPRCSVPAVASSGFVHGTGPSSAPVAEPFEPPRVAGRQRTAREAEEGARGDIQQNRSCARQFGERGDVRAGHDLTAVRGEVVGKRVHDGLAATERNRPARRVRVCREHEPGRRRREIGQAPVRVREHAREHGRCGILAEARVPGRAALLQRTKPEGREHERVPRESQQRRSRDLAHLGRVLDQGREEPTPGRAVGAEAVDRPGQVTVGDPGPAAVERMRVRDVWHDEPDAPIEPELPEEGRRESHRMHRGTHVVQETAQGELRRARPSADRRRALIQRDTQAGAGEHDRRRETVGPSADDDRVELSHRIARRGPSGARRPEGQPEKIGDGRGAEADEKLTQRAAQR